jgi:hypothetical protein
MVPSQLAYYVDERSTRQALIGGLRLTLRFTVEGNEEDASNY